MTPVTRIVRRLSPDQPVERPGTLEDIRADVLAPDRQPARQHRHVVAVLVPEPELGLVRPVAAMDGDVEVVETLTVSFPVSRSARRR